MKRKIGIAFMILMVICTGLVLAFSKSPIKELEDLSNKSTKKPIILIMVDSLMSEPLQKAVKEGKAPAFSFLMNHGHFHPEMISSYPTMSVTIDSTLLTGTYPDQHKVPGLIWFKKDENRRVSYGSDIRETWNNGVRQVASDSIIHLNQNHLSKEVQTIHEELTNRQLSSASINGLIYRGSVQHQLNVPKLISMAHLLPKKIEINGPTLLSLGTLSQYNPENDRHKFVWNRMGVNNKFSTNELKYVIEQKNLPSFTMTYLPDGDASMHKHGPNDLKGIEKADQALQDILNRFSSWEEAIQEVTWIVLGDSGQSIINKDKETSIIDLNKSLKDYTFWENKKRNAQLAIAINDRMSYIYVNDKQVELSEIVNILKKDERIGFIAWKDEQKNHVVSPQSDEEFTFSPKGSFVDEFEQSWDMNGNTSILDLKVLNGGRIKYQHYPDPLARLHGALHSQEGRVIIVDAKPSYEFVEEHSQDHAGGATHGSLHQIDSIVPIIVTGTNDFPKYNRLVDVKEWILKQLGGS